MAISSEKIYFGLLLKVKFEVFMLLLFLIQWRYSRISSGKAPII